MQILHREGRGEWAQTENGKIQPGEDVGFSKTGLNRDNVDDSWPTSLRPKGHNLQSQGQVKMTHY